MDHHITPRVARGVGITGAGGTPYAAAVIRGPLDAGEAVDLGTRTPEETAVPVAAGVVTCRWGGTGLPLTGLSGDTHRPAA
ncbi:hypothetical protein ACIQCJ_29195 [Streptomyces sp. NPDC093221]|uniref:hypothetical protein n=1 Tax=Streptomyces sp. NPDC093221 TaxID=3366032 RepID=UPI003813EF77